MIVYLITDLMGRQYVGKTQDILPKCWREHVCAAKAGSELHLHRAIRDHGVDSFVLSVLRTCSSVKELDAVELSYLNGCTPV